MGDGEQKEQMKIDTDNCTDANIQTKDNIQIDTEIKLQTCWIRISLRHNSSDAAS